MGIFVFHYSYQTQLAQNVDESLTGRCPHGYNRCNYTRLVNVHHKSNSYTVCGIISTFEMIDLMSRNAGGIAQLLESWYQLCIASGKLPMQ